MVWEPAGTNAVKEEVFGGLEAIGNNDNGSSSLGGGGFKITYTQVHGHFLG